MKLIYYLLVVIFSIRQVISPSEQFCSTLCNVRQCEGLSFNHCQSCTLGFVKASSNPTDLCIVNPALYNVTTAKYQPVGKSSELNYDMLANYTVQTIIVTGANYTGNCKDNGDAFYDYTYYGDLTLGSKITLDHSGITDISFWKIRIRYWAMIINQWKRESNIVTTFIATPPISGIQTRLDTDSYQQRREVCGGDFKQRHKIIDHQFTFNQTGVPLQFQISAETQDPTNNIWGVKQFVIMARLCHPYCTACFGDSNNQCTLCDYANKLAMLSGTLCDTKCDSGYGFNSTGNQICIDCVANCTSCLDYTTYCVNCTIGYYLWTDPVNTTVVACLLACPTHYLKNDIAIPKSCDMCDSNCLNCSIILTNCTSCNTNFYFYKNKCYAICQDRTYENSVTAIWTCIDCNLRCTICQGSSTNCTECETNGTNKSYLKNNTCLIQCGTGYFQDNNGELGPNICTNCSAQCTTCDINSTHCFSCTPSFYLYLNTCGATCTQPNYFADNISWRCLNCDLFCVSLTTKLYFSSNLKNILVCDLMFSEDLNWTLTDFEAFVTISENDPILDLSSHMNVIYSIVSPKIYRIQIKPKGYIFIYNSTFQFKTLPSNGTMHRAINNRPFKISNYEQVSKISWFLIKTPGLSDFQNDIIDSVSKFSDKILDITTTPYIQQIKKAGAFLLLISGAQATSTSCLVNNIPSQNLYEGVRLWASFVFFDVPEWEQNSDKSKYLILSPIDKIIENARLLQQNFQQNRNLFDTSNLEWRFQRTGHTSFFIFDVYMNIILIVACWILILIGNNCIKHKIKYQNYMGKFYSFTHKVHEVAIFYVTLSTLLQWIYFDSNSLQRWISLGICIFCNVYFLAYQLYIYYDMIKYPQAKIGNKYYQYYVLKYGSLLKNIRFQEYDPKQPWSLKHWIRPYNYHIFSFYKKFLMMIALPIFYQVAHAQISALILIQLFQIIRFLLCRPFKSKIHNFLRFSLEITLLGFFVSVLIQGYMVIQIMKNDDATLSGAINLFYSVGWAGFVLVFIFNIGHIFILIYNIVIGCKTTNKQFMDEARKNYYMQRISTYQEQNVDVPITLLNQWVKLGNLNNRNYDILPDVNLRIQFFKIKKVEKGFQIQIRKIFNAFMNIQFNFQKEFNIATGKKLQKQITLRKQIAPELYNLVAEIFNKYNQKMYFQYITIKTFQNVIQSEMQPGQQVLFNPLKMFQRLQLETYAGQSKQIKLDSILAEFPLKKEQLDYLI